MARSGRTALTIQGNFLVAWSVTRATDRLTHRIERDSFMSDLDGVCFEIDLDRVHTFDGLKGAIHASRAGAAAHPIDVDDGLCCTLALMLFAHVHSLLPVN